MTELIQVQLPDGEKIWARVTSSGPSDVGFGEKLRSVEGFTEAVRGVVSNVQKGLEGLRPDDLTVEFGLELALAEEGVVAALVGVHADASVKVTASWSAKP
ncbi:hypothetical protein Cs7R123_49330 [Catellatospora sp. TT07R-123]|uniref:CU044_2847 family protein n=1 Tax=Catellatospora sp. TT07R-123 TaxID=2733863 RepID=UPI001B03E8E3|nr:CU044_2847 family protein [Catellatospora sp. TT07R-123]GHJ47591.1 hypothetical protein Cs7R123_49330 [Catellatospora sp. TT07R-123]